MLGLGTVRRTAGEVRRDVGAAYERDAAATNVAATPGAKLLGPITIGHGAKIGATAVVIHDVPPNSTVVGNPGHPVRIEGRKPEGPDADWVHLPDPIANPAGG